MGLASDWNGRTLSAKHPQKTGEKYNQKSLTKLLEGSFKSQKHGTDDSLTLLANPSTPELANNFGRVE
jgi:hypothetical protein